MYIHDKSNMKVCDINETSTIGETRNFVWGLGHDLSLPKSVSQYREYLVINQVPQHEMSLVVRKPVFRDSDLVRQHLDKFVSDQVGNQNVGFLMMRLISNTNLISSSVKVNSACLVVLTYSL